MEVDVHPATLAAADQLQEGLVRVVAPAIAAYRAALVAQGLPERTADLLTLDYQRFLTGA